MEIDGRIEREMILNDKVQRVRKWTQTTAIHQRNGKGKERTK